MDIKFLKRNRRRASWETVSSKQKSCFDFKRQDPPTPPRCSPLHTSPPPTGIVNHSVMQDGAEKQPDGITNHCSSRRLKSEADIAKLHCYSSVYHGDVFSLHQKFLLLPCSDQNAAPHCENGSCKRGGEVKCQTPGYVVGIPPADRPQNRWLNVPFICASFLGLTEVGIKCEAYFYTWCACEKDKAFIKDWESVHGSHIKFHQTGWNYSAL